MHNVLVTGGCGYIGSHTAIALMEEGCRVVIADNLSNSDARSIDRIEKITGLRPVLERTDISDAEACHQLFERHAIDAIIHFAAHKYVNESVREPLRYYRNNFVSTLNLLREMQLHQVRHFIFSSSCTVYGEPDTLPVTEESPVKQAMSPYGNTKQVIEEILSDCCKADENLHVIALRYFNPIGAHPSGEIGEIPHGIPQNLLPYLTQTAIGIRECLSVYGNDYDTPDGSCIRDYIHVYDLAKAHVCAMNRMMRKQQKQNYEVFNISTGNGYTVLQLIKTFEKVSGKKLNYKIVGRREGDIPKIWADTRKANEELGWKAAYDLEDMLRSAWQWEQRMQQEG
ncbi:MAG: UDP-glucose 4-epimerase GalE [Bacteroidales bacterium]|nr:UDP-glucose 4-epimerase GalE [Bacteroidales bacterium]